jgi:hypothetical protein
MPNDAMKDAMILAEAAKIRDDDERSKAVRELSRGKSRKADVFAGKGSLSDKLRKRRMAVESGDIEDAQAAFNDDEG